MVSLEKDERIFCMRFANDLFPRLEAISGQNPLALELQSGLMVCAAVSTAVELGLPVLLDQPKSVTLLAQKTATHEPSLLSLLRALAHIGIFRESDPHVFGPTERSRLLRDDRMGALVKLWGAPYQWQSWMKLTYTIQTGRPALEATYGEGATIWSYLDQHQDDFQRFQLGLQANARLIIPALLNVYDFLPIKTLVDVGGGYGGLCHALLVAYPYLHVTLFERPEVIAHISVHTLPQSQRDRYQLHAGDFFANLPSEQDCYLFKHVLMDWSDPDYVLLMLQCASAMTPESRVLIIEPIAGPQSPFTAFFSLQMTMMMRQAHHRTLEEHRALAHKAGLILTSAQPLGMETMVLELRLSTVVEGGVR
jgi:hypothetical protein